jgi:Cof subfamily protein (haloacid dehalogenase superfamily)
MAIDIIALDLDDTLLRADLSISEGNKRALARARDAGIRIVLASGRNVHSMRSYAEELGLLGPGDYMICSNGAETVHSSSGRLIDERRLDPELCREIADAIEEQGFPWQIYEEGMIHVNLPNPWALEDSRLTGQPTILVEDREEFFARGLIKFVVPGEPERVAALLERLRSRFRDRVIVLTSKPYFLELLPPGADKGSALERLTRMLGLPMSRAMAIGDAMNDLGMVASAGCGCAPANAIPEVKAAARYVSVRSNEEDAVADLVERLAFPGAPEVEPPNSLDSVPPPSDRLH